MIPSPHPSLPRHCVRPGCSAAPAALLAAPRRSLRLGRVSASALRLLRARLRGHTPSLRITADSTEQAFGIFHRTMQCLYLLLGSSEYTTEL